MVELQVESQYHQHELQQKVLVNQLQMKAVKGFDLEKREPDFQTKNELTLVKYRDDYK